VTGFPLTLPLLSTLVLTGVIMLVSLLPGSSRHGDYPFSWLVTKTPTLLQKVLHVCLYAILALLLVWTLDDIQPREYRLLIAFILAVAFGAVMEWCQTLVPGRYGTVFDVALNAAGAALGLLAAAFLIQN
jgi:VanZ family protein